MNLGGPHWRWLQAATRRLLFLQPTTSPIARLIRQTALKNWRLLMFNVFSTLLLAAAEACSFAVIYQAARILAGAPPSPWFGIETLPRGTLFMLLLASAVVFQLLGSVNRYLNGLTTGYFSARCQARITPEVHRQILRLSYTCASRFKAGELVHSATLSPMAVQIEIEQFSQITSHLLLALIYVGTLVLLSPVLLVVALALGGAVAALQSVLRPKIRQASGELERARQAIAATITEDVQILRLLHSTAGIGGSNRRLREQMVGLEVRMRQLTRLVSLLEPVSEMLPVLAAVGIVALSMQFSGDRSETLIPGLVTFVLALQRLNNRLIRMAQNCNLMAENNGRVEQLDELLCPEDKEYRRRGGRPFTGLVEDIRFEGVGLRYKARSEPTLSGIDLVIPRGGTVALVGASGAGKSSLADLLIGLLEPTEGRILVDGTDLLELDLDSWQRRLGVVSQDVLLVNDTIRANIAFGQAGDPTDAMVRAAAVSAGADEFITLLTQGYATVIGERGYRLSGGQRQRLSLARAILRDPQILILDEATSALDSHSEAHILRSLEAFRSGRTVLTIAHRLSSIVHADQIAVVEHGKIVERGRHSDLLARQGVYMRLWRRQQKGVALTTTETSP